MKAVEGYCSKCKKVKLWKVTNVLIYSLIIKCKCGSEIKILKEDCGVIESE